MSQTPSYADVEIRIFEKQAPGYPVEITLQGEQEYLRGYFQPEALPWLSRGSPTEDGERLFQQLFADHWLKIAWAEIQGRQPLRRIRLRIDPSAPELHGIPWELLREPGDRVGGESLNLAAATATPFSRYLAGQWQPGRPTSQRPIRILVAIADPANLAESKYRLANIDADQEWNLLHKATLPLQVDQKVELVRLPAPCTLKALETELQQGYHGLHFVGHGAYSPAQKQAILLMADEDNEVTLVRDVELAEMLARQLANTRTQPDDKLRLVFLASCQSASRSQADAFQGLAPKLVAAGVPAVIAMQDFVSFETARTFAQTFYRRLLSHGQVDLAANEARSAALTGQRADAGVPVLFMRLETGQLLAPDPVLEALQNILDHQDYTMFATGQYLRLPIDVVHLTGQQKMDNLEQLKAEATARADLLKTALRLFELNPPRTAQPRLLLLVGGHSSNKSTQLKRLAWQTAQTSLKTQRRLIPVYCDLQSYPAMRSSLGNPIQALIVESLKSCWPDLTGETLVRLLDSQAIRLRVLFDGSDELPERERLRAWEYTLELLQRPAYRDSEYMMALQPVSFQPVQLFKETDLHLLVIQPLARHKIRYFLEQEGPNPQFQAALHQLKLKLDQSHLYDLAAIPWFLFKMIRHAQAGDYPESRTQILQRLIKAILAEFPADQGMRSHAETLVYQLAWQMQSNQQAVLPLNEFFELMATIRGSRDYSLETLYSYLVESDLLGAVGDEGVRFEYPPFQAHCCARAIFNLPEPKRQRVLNDIAATFGRPTRLRWWSETFVLVSGLLAQQLQPLIDLLQTIVYGDGFFQSNQAFLIARCLIEVKRHEVSLEGPSPATDKTVPAEALKGQKNGTEELKRLHFLTKQVIDALIWRLNSRNEPRLANRVEATELLGQLASPTVVSHLAEVAKDKVRIDLQNKPDYDFSSIRLAAVLALQYLTTQVEQELDRLVALNLVNSPALTSVSGWQGEEVTRLINQLREAGVGMRDIIALAEKIATVDPHLIELLYHWRNAKEKPLIALLRSRPANEQIGSAQALAALALGDIYVQLEATGAAQARLDEILQALVKTFFQQATLDATRWAVTHALAMLDTATVTEAVLLPAVQAKAGSRFNLSKNRLQRYKCLAYLIGRLRCQEASVLRFLKEDCLKTCDNVSLAASIIEALGWLADETDKDLLESLAVDQFEPYLSQAASFQPKDRHYLRRRAIEALVSLGDLATLDRLRTSGVDWDPELRRIFYQTSEEIHWRLGQNSAT